MGKFEEHGPAGDDGGIHFQVFGDLVAARLQLGEAAALGLGLAARVGLAKLGMIFGVQGEGGFDGETQALAAAFREMARNEFAKIAVTSGGGGDLRDGLVAKNEVGRAIGGDGFLFAPMPNFAHDGEAEPGKLVAAANAPDVVRIMGGRPGAFGDEAGAGFLKPAEAAKFAKLGFENISERFEIVGVMARIGFHARRERTTSPVRFLRAFFEGHTEVFLDKVEQAELALAEQPAGEHGVNYLARDEVMVLAKQAQIIVRPVHNETVLVEFRPKRGEINRGKGIDEEISFGDAEVEQA